MNQNEIIKLLEERFVMYHKQWEEIIKKPITNEFSKMLIKREAKIKNLLTGEITDIIAQIINYEKDSLDIYQELMKKYNLIPIEIEEEEE